MPGYGLGARLVGVAMAGALTLGMGTGSSVPSIG